MPPSSFLNRVNIDGFFNTSLKGYSRTSGGKVKIYVYGVIVAFTLSVTRLIISYIRSNSLKSKNLAKVGMDYNFIRGDWELNKKIDSGTILYWFFIIVPLFSWISVILKSLNFFIGINYKRKLPEKIREIDFKLEGFDLPKDSVVQVLKELRDFYPTRDAQIDSVIEKYEGEFRKLSLGNGDCERIMRIYPREKQLIESYRSSDHHYYSTTTYEYRFEKENIFTRVTDEKAEFMGETENYIREGIVIEEEIRKKCENKLNDFEFELKVRKDLVLWKDLNTPKIIFLIYFNHQDIFPIKHISTILISHIKRIKKGKVQFDQLLNTYHGRIIKNDFNIEVDIQNQEHKNEVLDLLKDSEKLRNKFDISKEELIYFNETLDELDAIRNKYGLE